MEILNRGELPEERNWVGTCNQCHSRIRAKQKELEIHHCQREGSWGTANCPVCSISMYFYPERKIDQGYWDAR